MNEFFDKEEEATLLPRYYRGTSEPPVVTGGTGAVPDSGQNFFMIVSFYFDWVQMYPLRYNCMIEIYMYLEMRRGGFKY